MLEHFYLLDGFTAGEVNNQHPVTRGKILQPGKEGFRENGASLSPSKLSARCFSNAEKSPCSTLCVLSQAKCSEKENPEIGAMLTHRAERGPDAHRAAAGPCRGF